MHFHLLTEASAEADFVCVHGYLVDVKEDAHEGHKAKVLVLDPTDDDEENNADATVDAGANFPAPSLLTRIPAQTSKRADESPVDLSSLLWLSVRRLPRKEKKSEEGGGFLEALEFLA